MKFPKISLLLLSMSSLLFATGEGQPFCAGTVDSFDEWTRQKLGNRLGSEGIVAVDFGDSGHVDVVIGQTTQGNGPNNQWIVLRQNANGLYIRTQSGPIYQTPFLKIVSGSIQTGTDPSLFVIFPNGTIHEYDPVTATLLSQFNLEGQTSIQDLILADFNGDNVLDFISSAHGAIKVFSGENLNVLASFNSFGGSFLAFGNVDGDANPELISLEVGGTSRAVVLDTLFLRLDWDRAEGFGSQVVIADLDGQGNQEIVGLGNMTGRGVSKVAAFQLEGRLTLWEQESNANKIMAYDLNNDGLDQILLGTPAGNIDILSNTTGEVLEQIPFGENAIVNFNIANTDTSNSDEILIATEGGDLPDFFTIATLSGQVHWQSAEHGGGAVLALADQDGDDEMEFITAPAFRLYVFNAVTGEVERFSDLLGDLGTLAETMVIGDVDNDGSQELVIGGKNGSLIIADLATLTLEQEINAGNSSLAASKITKIQLVELTQDESPEILIGYLTPAQEMAVAAMTGNNGNLLWQQTLTTGSIVLDIASSQFGDTFNPQIYVGTGIGGLFVLNGLTGAIAHETANEINALSIFQANGSSVPLLYQGTTTGEILVMETETFGQQKQINYSDAAINGLVVQDLHADECPDIFIADQQFGLMQELTETVLWQTADLGDPVFRNHLVVSDFDDDQYPDVVFGSSEQTYKYELTYCGESLRQYYQPQWPQNKTILDLIRFGDCL